MAIGKASDFKIYQNFLRTRINELLTQYGENFASETNGAIRVSSISRRGDYTYGSFIPNITGLVTRRDNTSTAAVTDIPILQDEFISVKLSRKIGPAAQTRDAFRKAVGTYSETEFTDIIAEQAANGMRMEMLNTGLAAVRAALKQQTASYVTQSSLGAISTDTLVSGLAALGDRQERVRAWVMHSHVWFDLMRSQINANLTGVSDLGIARGSVATLGRPVFVTDSSSLILNLNSPDVNNYITLGLTEEAVVVENTESEEIVVQDVTGLDTLVVRYQGEYAYNLGLKGFKWDVQNGGANPNATAVATGTNWDTASGSHKDRAGVAIMTL